MQNRREFVEFFGRAMALGAAGSGAVADSLRAAPQTLPIRPLAATAADTVDVAGGLSFRILIKEGDPIGPNMRFGANNDYICWLPHPSGSQDDALLWINHEDFTPIFTSGYDKKKPKTKAQVELERRSVGGSIVRLKRQPKLGWSVIHDDPLNRRLDATTEIPLVADRPIAGSKVAIGTLGNCSGGITPWGSILSAEENYQNFYGEVNDKSRNPRSRIYGDTHHGWDYFFDHSPEHYGYIVEVDPRSGNAKKLTALGRFCHEGALVLTAADGRPVVYMGDDAADQCIYKFIASEKGSLERGELFVANITSGEWRTLNRDRQERLRLAFADQTAVLVKSRRAASLVGGTKLARPEDIKQDPVTKAIYVALTNNKAAGDLHGSILKIEEDGRDPLAMRFKSSTFLTGGPEALFSCPDNFAFDRNGNLWMTCDISSSAMNAGPYERFRNNGLFFIPMRGPGAGVAVQIASAPRDAEFTSPCFSPDGEQLLLSVQHPGEETVDLAKPTSVWPDGPGNPARSAVIALSGSALDSLLGR